MSKRIPKYWLEPPDAYLERVKRKAKELSRHGCDPLISVDLLRMIATIRHMRGGCPNCGKKRGHALMCAQNGPAKHWTELELK